jgi:hypothetical protein
MKHDEYERYTSTLPRRLRALAFEHAERHGSTFAALNAAALRDYLAARGVELPEPPPVKRRGPKAGAR